MTIASMLLRAPRVGVRELKTNLSKFLKRKGPFIVTDRGNPIDVMLPYAEVLEMIELLDETTDLETLEAVKEGRNAIKGKAKGIPFLKLFHKTKK